MRTVVISTRFIAQDIASAGRCMHLSTPLPLIPCCQLPCACRILCGMGRRPRRPNLKLCVTRRRCLEGPANNACWGVLFSFVSFRFLSLLRLLLLHSIVGTPFWVPLVAQRAREGPAARMRIRMRVVTMTSYFRLPFGIVSRCVGVLYKRGGANA